MDGKILRVTAVVDPEFAYMTNVVMTQNGRPQFRPSITTEFLEALQLAMNVTFVIQATTDWGARLANGSWTGAVGQISDGTADLCVTPFAILRARQTVLDYNLPIVSGAYTAIFKRPNFISDTRGIFKPLRQSVWLALAAMCIVMLIYVALRSAVQSFYPLPKNIHVDITSGIIWAIGTLCLRETGCVLTAMSSRALAITASLLSIVIWNLYSGTVLSFLTVHVEPIRSLDQLLGTSYDFAMTDVAHEAEKLKGSELPNINTLYDRSAHVQAGCNVKARLLSGSYVFVASTWDTYRAIRKTLQSHEQCAITQIILPQIHIDSATFLAKNSTWKRPIDHHIIRFKQYGLNSRWVHRYVAKMPECIEQPYKDAISFENMELLIYGLIAALSFSIGLVLAENLFNWNSTRIK